jgi:hypothetical protein
VPKDFPRVIIDGGEDQLPFGRRKLMQDNRDAIGATQAHSESRRDTGDAYVKTMGQPDSEMVYLEGGAIYLSIGERQTDSAHAIVRGTANYKHKFDTRNPLFPGVSAASLPLFQPMGHKQGLIFTVAVVSGQLYETLYIVSDAGKKQKPVGTFIVGISNAPVPGSPTYTIPCGDNNAPGQKSKRRIIYSTNAGYRPDHTNVSRPYYRVTSDSGDTWLIGTYFDWDFAPNSTCPTVLPSWVGKNTLLGVGSYHDLAFEPFLLRSTDGALSWEILSFPVSLLSLLAGDSSQTDTTNLYGRQVFVQNSFFTSLGGDTILWIGAYTIEDRPLLRSGSYSLTSTDRGVTWSDPVLVFETSTVPDTFLDFVETVEIGKDTAAAVRTITTDPSHTTYVREIWMTTNAGVSWFLRGTYPLLGYYDNVYLTNISALTLLETPPLLDNMTGRPDLSKTILGVVQREQGSHEFWLWVSKDGALTWKKTSLVEKNGLVPAPDNFPGVVVQGDVMRMAFPDLQRNAA